MKAWPLRILTWACVGVAVLMLVFPFAAEYSIRDFGAAPATRAEEPPEPLTPGTGSESGLPHLPLVTPGGFIERSFPNGITLEDREGVLAAIDALALELGLSAALADIDAGLAAHYSQPQYDDASYPYVYEPFDSILEGALIDESVRSNQEDVVDLASLLYLNAVLANQRDVFDQDAWDGALAYSLLNAAREHVESCDIQTNLLFVMATGLRPRHEDLLVEASEAERLCGADEPTPSWIRAKALAAMFGLGEDPRIHSAPLEDLKRMAVEAFEELEERFPELPFGYAGHADLLLNWADQAESIDAAPFQARQWRVEAERLYAKTRAGSTDPRLLVGHARALSELRRHEEAVAAAEQAVELRPEDFTARVILAEVLSAAGEHARAAAAVQQEHGADLPWWQTFRSPFRPDVLGGTYGSEEFPPTLVLDASTEDFGGAAADDLGFFPTARHPEQERGCRGGVLLTEHLLAHQPDQALRLLDGGLSNLDVFDARECASRPEEVNPLPLDNAELRAVAELASSGTGDDASFEWWQDMLRADGQLDEARRVAQSWVEQQPENGQAWQRLGEIEFLAGDPRAAIAPLEAAATHFESDAHTWSEAYPDSTALYPPHELAWAHLQLGAAHAHLGDADEAAAEFHRALNAIEGLDPADYWGRYLTMHTRTQLGMLSLHDERWADAIPDLRTAVEVAKPIDNQALYQPTRGVVAELTPALGGMLKGAQENNLALALAMNGRHPGSIRVAEDALRRDPANPVFSDTLAFALQKAGRPERAAEVYDRALELDATSYVSANNRAVVLARGGKADEAVELLEAAIAVAPDYAIAWHNLGIVKSRSWSPSDLLQSQGALGRAAELDSDLRGSGQRLIMDDEIYDSGVDVSRPIAPEWTYAASARAPTKHLTITMLVLLLLRVAWALGLERFGGFVSERVVGTRSRVTDRFGWWWRALPAPFAVAVTVVVLVGATLFGVPDLTVFALLGAAGALVGLALIARRALAARQGATARHYGWPPAMAVGVFGTPFGLGFAPFPSLDVDQPAHGSWVRWIAPATIAGMGALLFAATVLTGVPLARSTSAAAMLLLGSMLLPVHPLDGAQIKSKAANLLITVALASGTVAFAAHWV